MNEGIVVSRCVCVKEVLDVNQKIIFNKNKIYDVIKQEAIASTYFGGRKRVIQYRIYTDNLDLPVNEDRFELHFKPLDEHRQEKINLILKSTPETTIYEST